MYFHLTFCRSGVPTQLSWILCSGSPKADKVSARVGCLLELRVLFQIQEVVGSIYLLVDE